MMSISPEKQTWSDTLLECLPYVSLLIVVVVIYGPVAEFGLLDTWDDRLFFVTRPEVRDWLDATWRQRLLTPEVGYPVPLQTFLYFVVQQAPGEWVVPLAHGLNVVVHFANALLVFVLSVRWLENRNAAWLAAFLWVCHPLMVEPVAWVTGLKHLTMAFFALCALYAWDRHLEASQKGEQKDQNWWWAVGTWACAVGAVASQPVGLGIGPALVAQTFLLGGDGQWKQVRVWAPLVAVAVVLLAYLPVAALGHREVVAGSSATQIYDMTMHARLERIAAAFFVQVRNVVWPFELHPTYVPTPEQQELFARVGSGLLVACVLVTAVLVWKRPRVAWPLLLGWSFYLPVSGIEFLPRLTADSYAYLPLFGGILALTRLLDAFLREQRRLWKVIAIGLACFLVVAEITLATLQVGRWENTAILIAPALEEYPHWVRGYDILSDAYLQIGAEDQALEVLEDGYEIQRAYGHISQTLPILYERTGQPAKAAGVLAVLSTYEGKKPPNVEAELVRVIVEYKLRIPSVNSGGGLRSELEVGLDQAVVLRPPAFFLEAARHFTRIEEFELASRALEAGARADSSDCDWIDRARQWANRTPGVDAPTRPTRCNNN